MATQVSVAAVTYPLFGDGPPQNYLKSLITGHQIMEKNGSYADSIVQGTLNGSGLRMRNFARWAERGIYGSLVGMPTAQVQGQDAVDEDDLKEQLKINSTDTVEIISADIGDADITFWAQKWMWENHPSEINLAYTVDTDDSNGLMLITVSNGNFYTAPLVGYSQFSRYLYVNYNRTPVSQETKMYYFIYQNGSGNSVLDLFFESGTAFGRFFPIIPVINEGQFLSNSHLASVYKAAKSAMRKAFPAGNYDKLVNDIRNNNPSVGDIDFANISFGVSINTTIMESMQYIFEFMRRVRAVTPFPLYAPYNGAVRIAYESAYVGKYTGIVWNSMGLLQTFPGKYGSLSVGDVAIFEEFTTNTVLIRQTTESYYQRLSVTGLQYVDNVYKTKSVGVWANFALSGQDTSPFIFPLDIDVLREMGLVNSNQFCNYTAYLTFNCYEVNKQKWYQDGFFNVLVFMVVVVISIVTAGTGAPAGTGLLGSATAIGGALGFSGTLALVIGTLANYLAAMVLVKIIQAGAQKLFGDELGAIVGNIAGMLAVSYGTALMNGGSMATAFPDMSDPVNLMKFSASIGGGYDALISNSTLTKTQRDLAQLEKEAEALSRQIDQLYEQNLGSAYEMVAWQRQASSQGLTLESMNSFLSRTLMTGDDVIRISQSMLNDFASLTTSNDLPG